MSEKIYLHMVREGDKVQVVDQDGRQLAGLISVNFSAGVDQLVELDIRCADFNKQNSAHIGNCE